MKQTISLAAARKALRVACQSTPSIACRNESSRMNCTIHQQLIWGKRSRNAPYVVQLMDTTSPWIMPRYTKGWIGADLNELLSKALQYLSTHNPAMFAVQDEVNSCMVNPRPMRAIA